MTYKVGWLFFSLISLIIILNINIIKQFLFSDQIEMPLYWKTYNSLFTLPTKMGNENIEMYT